MLNLDDADSSWLNMKVKTETFYSVNEFGSECFGEHNQDRKLSGRGVRIDKFGVIFAGYYDNGNDAPGRFIEVRDDGSLFLGEWYYNELV